MMKYLTTAVLCLLAAMPLAAKDLKTEITVDRTIVPEEREAVRPASLMPKLLVQQQSQHRLSLADYTTPATLTRSAALLAPAAYADTFALSPYRGYASVGYLPAFNLGASAGYKFIETDKTSLGAWLQSNGCSYKDYFNKDAEGSNRFKDNSIVIGVDFGQRFGRNSLFAVNVDYSYAAMVKPEDFISNKQNASIFDADLSWCSRADKVAYYIGGSFSRIAFGKDESCYLREIMDGGSSTPYVTAPSQNRITFAGGVGYLGSSTMPRGGVEISADFLNRSGGVVESLIPGIPTQIYAKTLGVIGLTPYYNVDCCAIRGRVGAKIEVSTGGEGKKFHIAPEVLIDWNVSKKVALYAKLQGGEHLNSLRELFDYCHFVTGAGVYERSHIPVAADFCVSIGPISGFSASIFAGYAVANDWLMPIASRFATQFEAVDVKGGHAGVALGYELRKVLKINASIETAQQGRDKSFYMWRDRARYVAKASAEVRPIEPLRVTVAYEYRGKRCFYNPADQTSMGNVSDLTFGANYSFTPAFGVYARIENLLNKHYYILNQIPSQGIKGLVGFSYKF